MTSAFETLPSDLTAAHAMILAERAARVEAEAVAARAQAVNASTEALIAHLKLEIEKLRRELYGSRSERKARLLAQMELQLEDLEAAATEDELAAEKAAARTQTVKSFERKRPSRKPFPDHLPRERVVIAGRAVEAGEDITETLEVIPRQWKVIQTVREKFSVPSSLRITDFVLFAGRDQTLLMQPIQTPQSKPFQARLSSCSVSHKSPRTASSILSRSVSMRAAYHTHKHYLRGLGRGLR